MERSKVFFRGSPGFSTCLFHKVKVCVAQTVLSAGGGKGGTYGNGGRLPLGVGAQDPLRYFWYVFGSPRMRTPRHQDDMVTYHFLRFFLGTLTPNMKGFLGAYYDDVFLFVGPLDGKLGLSKNDGCFTLNSYWYIFWGELKWPFLVGLNISPFRANITSMQGSNPNLLWCLAFIANIEKTIKSYICMVPKKYPLKNWLFWLDDCKSLHSLWSLQLSSTGLFLYDNAVVSPFCPMGGELSFYLDIPSWELTYPLRMRFWVDDFPNFPFDGICDRFCGSGV